MSTHSPEGSLWHQWDLHFHTPSSYGCYLDKSVTNEQIVNTLVDNGIRVVAITDHHTIDVDRIKELQALGDDKLTVLPGIELRSDHGGEPVHYISIFSEDCDLDHIWTTLQGSLGLTTAGIAQKGGDDSIYIPIEKGADATRQLGGLVSIHAGAKTNSIESISNSEQFQQRIKFDITNEWVDVMEIGQLKDIDAHFGVIFPTTGLERPLIICSDNHNINAYARKARLWLRADPTFRGLLMVLREPVDRVYMGDRPSDHIRVEQNPTKYVRGITFGRKTSASPDQFWFSGSIQFNPGLVAIVGNKGSGKSALSDMIGLLGATKNNHSFSFLSRNRFRHPSGGYAQHFEATIEWLSGERITRCLADSTPPEELERLKYLPQDHVENICNELAGIDEAGFEQELKAVIFSHVPESSRLNQSSLDELVHFQTNEKQKRIDTLLKQMRELSRSRATLESQMDPKNKREIEEKVKRRQLEIDAHKKAKPVEIQNPDAPEDAPAPNPALLQQLQTAEKEKANIEAQIATDTQEHSKQQRRLAVAVRLLEMLANFKKEYDEFSVSLAEDAAELGLTATNLVSLSIKTSDAEAIRDHSSKLIAEIKARIGATQSDGLQGSLETSNKKVADLQAQLSAPNRAYQLYLKQVGDWERKLTELEGTPGDPDSLNGLNTALAALGELPSKISALRSKQIEISLQIHNEKVAQAAVYRTLYEPVQNFIDAHVLAKDKLKLEFRAELLDQGFTSSLLGLLALNRRGSFMGTDEGKAKADMFAQSVQWETPASVSSFVENVDRALHEDQREDNPSLVQLSDQLVKGRTPEDVFNLLYGLEYVQPRYILRWEGKDLSMLSPGERGTLLLVFYLLVDKSDLPLVIDQPEGNLDNHTVAKVLVDCIREAKRRRQVFIVTHNPNLAVVCDADQVIHADMDKAKGNSVTYTTGALENPTMTKYATDVLEGTRWAFGVRGSKYKVGD